MRRPSKSLCESALVIWSNHRIDHRRKISQAEEEGESNGGENWHDCNRLFKDVYAILVKRI